MDDGVSMLLRPQDVRLMNTFIEATAWERGGEVVLRCGSDTGRVFFAGQKIAWIAVSTIKRTFTTYLIEHTELAEEEVRAAFDECKQTGRNFGETIVEWGLLDENSLRLLLLQHISECMLEIFSWPKVEAMFMPEDREYKGSLTFDFIEVLRTVLILDTEGRLPFSGATAEEVIDMLGQAQLEASLIDVESTLPDVEAQHQPVPLQEEPVLLEVARERAPAPPEAESFMRPTRSLAEPTGEIEMLTTRAGPSKKGKGKFFLVFFLILAIAGGLAFVFLEELFPQKGESKPAPPPAVADEVADASGGRGEPPVEEQDAGGVVAEDAGTETDEPAEPADEAQPDPPELTGIVAGKPGKGFGSLRVESTPRRAPVFLDGVFTGMLTPATLTRVPAGLEHVVMVEKRGHKPVFRKLKVRKGKKTKVKLRLKKSHKRPRGVSLVKIVTKPHGARVFVDGEDWALMTPTSANLRNSSASTLELKLEGYGTWKRIVRPIPGEDLTFLVKLKKTGKK